jgi:ATP-dependent DNA helicase RecG
MTLEDLKKIVVAGESETVEFKRTTGQRTEAAKTVCAMLNGGGGVVLFGVTDAGELVGQEVSDSTLRDVVQELKRIEPAVFPKVTPVKLGNKRSVLVIEAKARGDVFTYDGRPYVRHGSATSIMPRAQYDNLLIEKLHPSQRWENQPVDRKVKIPDLDTEEIQRTVDTAIRLGRMEPIKDRREADILRGFGLMAEGRLLNAAVALYGKSHHLRIRYPQFSIRLARFRGMNRLADFSDNRQYWGHAFDLLRRGEQFLLDHVPIPGRVVPGKMVREDHPWYPSRATREAIANALCHRDYTVPGGAVAVAMYDDHLEITNPGRFHFGLRPDDLTKPHPSKPWNPLIASVFYRAGVIEQWGIGTLNILDWCKENGNPPPRWEEQSTGDIIVTFWPVAGAAAVKPPRQIGVESGVESGVELRAESAAAKVIRLLQEHPRLKSEIAQGLGKSAVTGQVHRLVNQLAETGFIERTIPDKPQSRLQRYRLTDKGRAWLASQKEATTGE